MKFICPYCKKSVTADQLPGCPHCGRVMNVPDKFVPDEKKKKRKKIRTQGERRADVKDIAVPDFLMGRRKPLHVIIPVVLLAVVGAMLLGKLGTTTGKQSRSRQELRAMDELYAMRIAMEVYKHDCGSYPTEEEGLDALVLDTGADGWAGHYVNIIKPDPWYEKYHYKVEDGQVVLFSSGPDRRSGTDDDLYAEEPAPEVIEKWIEEQEQRKLDRW